LQDPISKKAHHKKRADGVAQGLGPEFKPQNHKKKKNNFSTGLWQFALLEQLFNALRS
jgi:hypothetical protein